MIDIVQEQEFNSIFINDIPLLDVRAPIEYQKGAFVNSANYPLLVDDERAAVGTCYKQQGKQAAINLGHTLVCEEIKEQRVQAWREFFFENPQAYLYCFRGGMRSQITQQWLKEIGIERPYISGGYKALRQFLLTTIDSLVQQTNIIVLAGKTGSGKTKVLKSIKEAIDLESLANHRGSSFGRLLTPQPTQINFENNLAIQLIKHQVPGERFLLLEDESRLIGKCLLPYSLRQKMLQAPVLLLEESLAVRQQLLLEEYVHKMLRGYNLKYGKESGFIYFSNYLRDSIHRIKNRLGTQNHDDLIELIEIALREQCNGDVDSGHLAWITKLLERYYDPMFEYQLNNKKKRILFYGNKKTIIQYVKENSLGKVLIA